MKITDEVRPEVLTAKQTMLEAMGRLRLLTGSLMKWEEEAVPDAQKQEKSGDNEKKNE
jgi:hypothetical protein